jgi:hypothetical protein
MAGAGVGTDLGPVLGGRWGVGAGGRGIMETACHKIYCLIIIGGGMRNGDQIIGHKCCFTALLLLR